MSKLYFVIGCIPARILIMLIAMYLRKDDLPYYGVLLLGPAIGFLYLYFTNSRLKAQEAGGHTWWKNIRIFHGLLYLAAAVMAFTKNRLTWIPLAIDVVFGVGAFLYHYS
jgi:hypothetical protein